MENRHISHKYGFNFNQGKPSKNSPFEWQVYEYEKISQGLSKSEVAESSLVKIEKPRMMSVDYGR